MPETIRYDVPCSLGLEEALMGELEALGARAIKRRRGGVMCQGDQALGYAACLWLRSAVRVQQVLAEFDVDTEDDLYAAVRELPWEHWLDVDGTLAVDATVRDNAMTHSGYAALKVKDAIVDRFRDRTGSRPSVDRERPDLPLRLRLKGRRATLARDLAGDSLHKRGYRPVQVKSPLNESVAAGLLLLAGYDGTGTLVDPMCGSGTFLIEAALIAADRAPGLDRTFAFLRWPDHDAEAWNTLVQEALERTRPIDPNTTRFHGADAHMGAVQIALKTVAAAGFGDVISLDHAQAEQWKPPTRPDLVFTNPPWGERIEDAEPAWEQLAEFLRRACPGASAHVLSGNPELTRLLRMKAERRFPVNQGGIDCRMLRYAVRDRRSPSATHDA